MTAGAHDAGGGFGRSAGTNAARGVMVIVAAVAVGLLLMFQGLSDSDETAATDTTAADSTDGTGAETTDPAAGADTSTTVPEVVAETTTTLAAPRDPSTVKVLVLNGTSNPVVPGLAGSGTDVLKASNYVTLSPKNADVPGPSVIYFTDGFQADAVAVAAAYGVDPAAVVQPLDPAALPVADTQGANVIVRIGPDGVIQV